MHTVHLDFETRSVVDIKKCGAGKYAQDPSTRILIACWAVDDGPVVGVYGEQIPPMLEYYRDEGFIFCAQNAFFEMAIWQARWGGPLPRFRCTRAKLGAHGLPQSLESGARALRLTSQKDIEGRRLINKFCIPQKDGSFIELDDHPADKEKFMGYCISDVRTEREIDCILPNPTDVEQQYFDLTQTINLNGVRVDQELSSIAQSVSETLYERCNARLKYLTDGQFYSIKQHTRLKVYLNQHYGLKLEDVSADTLEEVLPDVQDPVAQEIIKLRLEYAQSSVSKFTRILGSVCDDGRVRDYLLYHGAHTGRWTSQIVQFHNLPRGGKFDPGTAIDILKYGGAELFEQLYDYPISALTECIRGVILPTQGKQLYVADYNAIEARVLMWMADQKDAVEMFRRGDDIYIDMARDIYNDSDLTKKDKDERQLGKQTILGAGFQMGPEKFQKTCKKYGIEIDEGFAKKSIYGYRNKYPMVPQYWEDVERAAKAAIRYGKAYRIGRVVFYPKKKFLYCRLPSGRDLAYYSPGFEDRETKAGVRENIFYFTQNSQTNTFGKTYTYGGKLVENIVQAVARDIMADAKLRLHNNEYSVLLSSHDEIISEGDPEFCSVDEMVQIMCTLPEWAEGCPITAEGWSGERYRK
jgi:DNA polymerase